MRNAITGLGRRDDVVRSPDGVVHVTRLGRGLSTYNCVETDVQ